MHNRVCDGSVTPHSGAQGGGAIFFVLLFECDSLINFWFYSVLDSCFSVVHMLHVVQSFFLYHCICNHVLNLNTILSFGM
jgi:hypothetical protein